MERAVRLHRMGYNCAQSVACALSEEVGVDENICFRLMEGFGSRHGTDAGNLRSRVRSSGCSGLFKQHRNPEPFHKRLPPTVLYGRVREQFLQKNGSTVCSELKGLTGGSMLRSCPGCIEDAVRIACSLMKDADGQP